MIPEKPIRHTPGPWHADRSDLHGDDPKRWSVFATKYEKPFYVASIENGVPGDSLETEEANARLIAAAPDLLDALRAFCGDYKSARFKIPGIHAAYEHALTVIAKAEGSAE